MDIGFHIGTSKGGTKGPRIKDPCPFDLPATLSVAHMAESVNLGSFSLELQGSVDGA